MFREKGIGVGEVIEVNKEEADDEEEVKLDDEDIRCTDVLDEEGAGSESEGNTFARGISFEESTLMAFEEDEKI